MKYKKKQCDSPACIIDIRVVEYLSNPVPTSSRLQNHRIEYEAGKNRRGQNKMNIIK